MTVAGGRQIQDLLLRQRQGEGPERLRRASGACGTASPCPGAVRPARRPDAAGGLRGLPGARSGSSWRDSQGAAEDTLRLHDARVRELETQPPQPDARCRERR